jgi:hypothetical protein
MKSVAAKYPRHDAIGQQQKHPGKRKLAGVFVQGVEA